MKQAQGKRKFLEKKAIAHLADGKSIMATARILKIDRSTLHRWLQESGFKKEVAVARRKSPKTEILKQCKHLEPQEFAAWARENYELSPADDQVFSLAVDALEMAKNLLLPESVRIQAMGAFQRLIKDVKLKSELDKGSETGPKRKPRQFAAHKGDPRGVLGVVNS